VNPQKSDLHLIPLTGDTFRFQCHSAIACFTKCCAQLNLILTPYDILRMKRRLGLTSDKFLETYGNTLMDSDSRFPLVKLRMRRDDSRKCPFVTSRGCSIYEDRPGSCRLYPLGRASLKPNGGRATKEKYFVVEEAHCLGFRENKEWTLTEWMANEGMQEYNTMNDRWFQIVTSPKSLGSGGDVQRKLQMFFMASYNLDRFREFVFESSFLRLFRIDQELQEQLARDDVKLMEFSFEWLNFSLFGEQSGQIKPAMPLRKKL
jgi:Fe-S-cluster containining protein